ncbi:adenylate/guanylate cyclase domain-containing protein [Nitrosomonas sp.]|uniref:CHASE2 domain-containing protein n=1 Tax=Nitrosomonas sp. TaxID=42353 RepID=UPI0033056F39
MKLWRWRFVFAIFIGLLGAAVYLSPQGKAIEEQFGLYWLFHLRGERTAPADIVVVAVDQASATRLELPLKPSLWSRTLHARLVDRLVKAGARVVAFDLVFDRPGSDVGHDEQFAAALKHAGNVVLVERLDFEETRFPAGVASDELHTRILQEYTGEILPIIAAAARAHAPFPLQKSTRVSYYWTFRPGGSDMPTLPSLLLQLSSAEVYEHFLDLLAGTDPALVRQLPANVNEADIEDLALDLRNIFIREPSLAEKLLQRLVEGINLDTAQQRVIHALIDLYGGSEMRYLNFYGPPRTIRTIPYHLLLEEGESHPETAGELDLTGKTVFVGFSAETISEQDKVRDDYQTVFSLPDGLTLSGVEIAATAFANLLEGESIRPAASLNGAFILLLWGMGICLLCFTVPAGNIMVHALGMALMGSLSFCVYGSVSVWLFEQWQLWIPLAIPLMVQLPAGVIGIVTLLYFEADRERRRIEVLFGGHRPEPVVRDMVRGANPIHTDGQLVYGACLATDAEKYTTLAETMDPRQLAALMHEYYGCLFEPVERYQGKVSDVIGDAMLAIWAAGSADALLRERACLACLDIISAVEHFNQGGRGHPPLPTRLGLHSGEMVLGNIGARQHYEYRAVGDIVNTANRIQGANKYLGTRLLVSEEVVNGLNDLLLRPLGRFLLPGKSQSVNLFELIARQSSSSAVQRQLCAAYEQALHICQTGDRAGALHQFTMIHEHFPEDGPTRFMLTYCRESRFLSVREPDELIISIQSK